MFPGFNFYPQQNNGAPPHNFKNPYADNTHANFAYYEEPSQQDYRQSNLDNDEENIQVPPHIQLLFNSGDPSQGQKNGFGVPAFANNFDARNFYAANMGQRPNAMMQFPGYGAQMEQPNANHIFQTASSTSNMSNGNSRNASLNNISSSTSQRVESALSDRKNTSSAFKNTNNKDYIKVINEDILLIEKIEPSLNQISMNHNKICPFCSKFINIKKCNFQNVCALFSNTSNRYYLTHFDCYLKSQSDGFSSKIIPLNTVTKASVKSMLNSLSGLANQNIKRSSKAYFVSLEGYHPISSYLLFKMDKLCNTVEQATQQNQILQIDLSKKSTSIFEPNLYLVPFNEFRLVVTIHITHSDEDPYTFDFLVDLSQINLTTENTNQFLEAIFTDGSNHLMLGGQIVNDSNNSLKSNINYQVELDTSYQSTGSNAQGKLEFGANVFLVLKRFSINLPLIRNEPARGKSTTSIASAEGNMRLQQQHQQQQKPMTQNKVPNKLHLNPNAPLFGNMAAPAKVPVQQNQAALFQQGMPQGNFGNVQGYKQPNVGIMPNMKPNMVQGYDGVQPNPYFNSPLFPQNIGLDQDKQTAQSYEDVQPNSDVLIPPGLGRIPGLDSNYAFYPNQAFPEGGFEPKEGNGDFPRLPPETFEDRPSTPDSFQLENEPLGMRGRVKSHMSNLYTAVLDKARRDSSLSNSPSVSKIQNQYFSGVSTPRSEHDPNPISGTPLTRFGGFEHGEMGSEDNSGNVQLTEDMINNFKLEDYRGQLVEFAKTYHGSRILQKFFPRANQQEIEIVIFEIQDKMDELMLDPYANYMFQTLAQSCSSEQRYNLLQKIAPSMIQIARDRKGTHSLQAVVSLINRDVEEKLIRSVLEGHVPELSFDAQATHLIQKLVVSISLVNINFIYEPVIGKFVEFANNSFGLCVLKQLMTKVEKVPEMKKKIVDLLYDNLEDLIQNPFGNYAVQHAIDIYPQDCGKILDKIIEKIVQYSNQKFSSNVIEKCFVNASQEYKRKFVMEVTKSDRLMELMKNKYGNYVILKILSTSDHEDKKALAQSLLKNVNSVNVPKYKNRWIQFLEENPMKIPMLNAQTIKPSQFKNSGPVSDSGNTSASDINSPLAGDGWGHDAKKGFKDMREEKSQFYHERNKGGYPRGNMGHGWEEPNDDNIWNKPNNNYSGFESKNYKSDNNNSGAQGGNARKGKNYNQKFYEKNQHFSGKGGMNNFY